MKQGDEVHVLPASEALERSLKRALRNHKRAQKDLNIDPVHDFRVALRRCRSLAEGLSAVNSDPVWGRLRKAAKRQQRALSDLRDIQVLRNWLEPLGLTSGPVGKALGSYFKKQQKSAKREALSSLKAFPRKKWKRWLRRLPAGIELIRVNRQLLAQLLLEQLSRIVELHHRWAKQQSTEIWHDLRVSVKRFRYMVESFLPEEGEAWSTELQGAQDLLGEGHDLDMLHDLVVKLARKRSLPKRAVTQALRRVDTAAQQRRDQYVLLVSILRQANGRSASNQTPAAKSGTVWERWRTKLGAMASINGRGGARSSRSVSRRGLRVAARANQYQDRPHRISSAP
jgi:CHAD domain-containing protein